MKYLLIFVGLLASSFTQAQLIHVVNEGSSNQKGSVGVIDALGNYTHIDSIAAYGNDLTVHPTLNIYSVIDGMGNILEYNFANTPLVGAPFQTLNANARQMEYHAQTGFKVVSCSQRPYIRIYDSNNQLVHALDTNLTPGIAEGVAVVGNKAYIAINNFGSDSLLQIVDIQTGALIKTIHTHVNPNNLIVDQTRQKLYIQILYYFQPLFEIQELDLLTDSITATHAYTNLYSYGGFTADQNFIYFTNNQHNSIARIHLQNWNLDSTFYNVNPYSLFADPEMNRLYFSETDFVSSGTVSWMDVTMLPLGIQGTAQTHVSPRIINKTRQITSNEQFINSKDLVYVSDNQFIWHFNQNKRIKLSDIQGKTIFESNELSLDGQFSTDHLTPGVYFWQTTDQNAKNQLGKIIIR